MDAAYLKSNVMQALQEAITSMAIKMPEDEVEYIGRYLKTYVERQSSAKVAQQEHEDSEAKLKVYLSEMELKKMLDDEKVDAVNHFENRYKNFLGTIPTEFKTKSSAMDACVAFIEQNLDIPSAYIAIKKTVGEASEQLNYVSAGPKQTCVKGKTLAKVAVEEGEDPPERQGISFEAFKLPEVPEDENAEEPADGEDAPPPKEPPTMQPLVIDNCMREKRCKFFGIPKLGSMVAVPFSYQSVEHEAGVTLVEGEEPPPPADDAEEGSGSGPTPPKLTITPKEAHFLIVIDSIGAYRMFKPIEIERVKAIGDEICKLFEKLERSMGESHIAYLESAAYKTLTEACGGEFGAKVAEDEAAASAKAAEDMAADPAMAEEGVSELLKPYKEAVAALSAWNSAVGSGAVALAFQSLKGHVLPIASPVLNLLYASACLAGVAPAKMQSVCGEPDWNEMKENVIESISGKLSVFDPAANRIGGSGLTAANTLPVLKAFIESNNLMDAGIYPSSMPICGALLVPWLTKALAAREAAVAYFNELKTPLE